MKVEINLNIPDAKVTIPTIWLNGEWCDNEGYNGNYFVFRRRCGEAYYLNKKQLVDVLRDLIYEL